MKLLVHIRARAALALAMAAPALASDVVAARPNILFIITDDQSPFELKAYLSL